MDRLRAMSDLRHGKKRQNCGVSARLQINSRVNMELTFFGGGSKPEGWAIFLFSFKSIH
jgi:hypothetical protein